MKDIIRGELFAVKGYACRIFDILTEMTDLSVLPECKGIVKDYHHELVDLFEEDLNLVNYTHQAQELSNAKEFKEALMGSFKLAEGMLLFPFNEDNKNQFVINFINSNYIWLRELHLYLKLNTSFDIQLPRENVIEALVDEQVPYGLDPQIAQEIPQFYMDYQKLKALGDVSSKVTSLEWQRGRKYESLIKEGHQHIFNKNLEKGLEAFIKANELKNTAEILTLIGWAYSHQGKMEKAKSFCLKAIKKDPDYGPPYNDLGTYIMNEGHFNEALKWFNLAKNAVEYQNREFPYINAGRAHMALKDMQRALEEFNVARELAPHNEELAKTVERLKAQLEKDKVRNDSPPQWPTV